MARSERLFLPLPRFFSSASLEFIPCLFIRVHNPPRLGTHTHTHTGLLFTPVLEINERRHLVRCSNISMSKLFYRYQGQQEGLVGRLQNTTLSMKRRNLQTKLSRLYIVTITIVCSITGIQCNTVIQCCQAPNRPRRQISQPFQEFCQEHWFSSKPLSMSIRTPAPP